MFKDKKRERIKISDDKKYIQIIYSNREIRNRLSLVSFYTMKKLAQIVGITFNDKLKKIPFEYELPKELNKYMENIIIQTEIEFRKYYKLKLSETINKKKTNLDQAITDKIMNHYVHLSSNYSYNLLNINGVSRFVNKYFDLSDYNKLMFVNIPNYCNETKNCYKRNEVKF